MSDTSMPGDQCSKDCRAINAARLFVFVATWSESHVQEAALLAVGCNTTGAGQLFAYSMCTYKCWRLEKNIAPVLQISIQHRHDAGYALPEGCAWAAGHNGASMLAKRQPQQQSPPTAMLACDANVLRRICATETNNSCTQTSITTTRHGYSCRTV